MSIHIRQTYDKIFEHHVTLHQPLLKLVYFWVLQYCDIGKDKRQWSPYAVGLYKNQN